MKIDVSEASGKVLDWLVSQAHGDMGLAPVAYSTDWGLGGPIIDRERIKVAPNLGGSWHGQMRHETEHSLVEKPVLAGWTNKHGPTPLIAAMRCYVASKLGDEVEVPDELMEVGK